MAAIAILIKDIDPAGVEVDVRSDSPMEEGAELTVAQGIALATTVFLGSLMGDESGEESEAASLELPAGVEAE